MSAFGEHLKNAARQAAVALRALKFPAPLRLQALMEGDPQLLLAALVHAIAEYSPGVHAEFVGAGVRVLGKPSDAQLAEQIIRACLLVLDVRAKLTAAQFMTARAFAEPKLAFVTAVARKVHTIQAERARAEALSSIRVIAHVPASSAAPPPALPPRFPTTHIRPATTADRSSNEALFKSAGASDGLEDDASMVDKVCAVLACLP